MPCAASMQVRVCVMSFDFLCARVCLLTTSPMRVACTLELRIAHGPHRLVQFHREVSQYPCLALLCSCFSSSGEIGETLASILILCPANSSLVQYSDSPPAFSPPANTSMSIGQAAPAQAHTNNQDYDQDYVSFCLPTQICAA